MTNNLPPEETPLPASSPTRRRFLPRLRFRPRSASPTAPNTQAPKDYRKNLPIWMQYLPLLRFKPVEPDIRAPLIEKETLEKILKEVSQKMEERKFEPEEIENAKKSIESDIEFLQLKLLRLFRERDYTAKRQQNDYRLYQLGFLILAAIATTLGSLQALSLAYNDRVLMAILAFMETAVALGAVYLATISGREPPLPLWLTNRRRAEQLRREYFRFLMNLQPYTDLDENDRYMQLAERAAEINRGVFPDESGVI